ncbi:hypothetical protein BDZ45DRAFT_695783 [Acephala macrosclerotiorum]|nr:hypothetical protein BDZ45DRAFT_695783 [Acephala macrosclerotiorum]
MKLCIVHLFNSIFSIGVFAELWTITSTRPRIHEPSLITLASSTTTSQPATATQIVLMQNETYPADGAGSRLLSVGGKEASGKAARGETARESSSLFVVYEATKGWRRRQSLTRETEYGLSG